MSAGSGCRWKKWSCWPPSTSRRCGPRASPIAAARRRASGNRPGRRGFTIWSIRRPRPELFFKAPAYRVSGPGDQVRIRRDSKWNVPEPELALVLSPHMKLIGYTIGNDMSSRDIEGENPLYLPQAKMYDHSCAIGPAITLAESMPAPDQVRIHLEIERAGKTVFDGSTTQTAMKRPLDELISWLGREISFPHGAVLLTGTGIVPGDDFTLAVGDLVHIDISGIGRLTNFVDQKE